MAKSQEAVATAHEEAVEDGGVKSKPYIEKCYEVIFNERSNDNDTVDVHLCVNGEQLTIQRGKSVIVPDRFLEAARATKHPVYRQEAGKDRKIEAWIQTFNYQTIREASWDEFRRFKSKGNKVTQDEMKRRETALAETNQ